MKILKTEVTKADNLEFPYNITVSIQHAQQTRHVEMGIKIEPTSTELREAVKRAKNLSKKLIKAGKWQ